MVSVQDTWPDGRKTNNVIVALGVLLLLNVVGACVCLRVHGTPS